MDHDYSTQSKITTHFFSLGGPVGGLFITVPEQIKEEEDQITFKQYMDKFLQEILDKPPIPG